jgi:hypothetical protein
MFLTVMLACCSCVVVVWNPDSALPAGGKVGGKTTYAKVSAEQGEEGWKEMSRKGEQALIQNAVQNPQTVTA